MTKNVFYAVVTSEMDKDDAAEFGSDLRRATHFMAACLRDGKNSALIEASPEGYVVHHEDRYYICHNWSEVLAALKEFGFQQF